MALPKVRLAHLSVSKFIIGGNPISGFSHRWPLPSTSQSMRHRPERCVPDCVAGFVGV